MRAGGRGQASDDRGQAGGRRTGLGAVLGALLLTAVLGTAGIVGVVSGLRGTPQLDPPVAALTDAYDVWARDADGNPVRWDACTPIRFVVSGRDGPATYPLQDLLSDVLGAVHELRQLTGLDLQVVGTSDELPSSDRPTLVHDEAGRARWADVLIGWRQPGTGGFGLRDTDRALAVPVMVGPANARVYTTGQVVLNADRNDLEPGNQDRSTSWGATIRHELAHILGLAHVDAPEELMHVYPGTGPVRFGPGDRAGLQAVGAGGGCLPVPAPRDVDLALPSR